MQKVTEVGAGWGLLGMSMMLLLLAAGCRDAPPGAGDAPDGGMEAPEAFVTVFFSRGGEAVGVRRILEQTTGPRGSEQDPEGARPSPEDVEAGLEAALKELLKGPTAGEQEEGLASWFSTETAHSLKSVSVDGQGNAIVDFHDLSPLIPSASSSAGSAMLLQQLNATVFHRPDARVVEYRIEGSCDAFWNWLQYDCQLVSRGSTEPSPRTEAEAGPWRLGSIRKRQGKTAIAVVNFLPLECPVFSTRSSPNKKPSRLMRTRRDVSS